MVGLKKTVTYARISPKNDEPSWGTQMKKKEEKEKEEEEKKKKKKKKKKNNNNSINEQWVILG